MKTRIPQPPVDPSRRDREHHDFGPGLILAVIGLVIFFCGARHLTEVKTLEGTTAWEFQLVRAFSHGGLEYIDPGAFPDPATLDDPALAAAAFERLDRLTGKDLRMQLRVNTGAVDPCPT